VTDRVRGVRQFRRRLGRAIRNRQLEIEAARERRNAMLNPADTTAGMAFVLDPRD